MIDPHEKTISQLMDGWNRLYLQVWGNNMEDAADALEEYHLTPEDAGGVPIGELTRYRDGHTESWLIIRQDDGTIRSIG